MENESDHTHIGPVAIADVDPLILVEEHTFIEDDSANRETETVLVVWRAADLDLDGPEYAPVVDWLEAHPEAEEIVTTTHEFEGVRGGVGIRTFYRTRNAA